MSEGLDQEFFSLFKSGYSRLSRPSVTSCSDRSVRVAKTECLTVVPLYTIRRHYRMIVSKPTEIFCRHGAEALRRFYPHQDRYKSTMELMECIQGDYHKLDVFVRWPGETTPVRVRASEQAGEADDLPQADVE